MFGNFVEDDVYNDMCEFMIDTLNSYTQELRQGVRTLFPMINGASGSGKTRMGWELAHFGMKY